MMLPPAVVMGPPLFVNVVPVLEKFPPKVVMGAPTVTVAPTPLAANTTLNGWPLDPEMAPVAVTVIVPPAVT